MNKLIVTVLLAVLVGCNSPGPTPTATLPGESLEWEKIADDWGAGGSYRYRESEPKMVITADLTQVAALSGQLRLKHLDIVQNVDFTDRFVITVYQGEKMSTGYSVEVIDVRLDCNAAAVYAGFLTPDPEEVMGDVTTSPYYVFRVKRTPELKGDFTFVLDANGKEIMRQSHFIP